MGNALSALDPVLRPWARDLINLAAANGLMPRVTSTRRSTSEQARLYRAYLNGTNPYPVAPPGSSAHELGLAFDMVVEPMDSLADLGAVWESWGGVWGGRFRDEVHFEYPGASQAAAGGSSAWNDALNAAGTVYDVLTFTPSPGSLAIDAVTQPQVFAGGAIGATYDYFRRLFS